MVALAARPGRDRAPGRPDAGDRDVFRARRRTRVAFGDRRRGARRPRTRLRRPGLVSYALAAPGVGLKAGLHHAGPPADPDEPGEPDAAVARWVASWVERRYPAADGAPIRQRDVPVHEHGRRKLRARETRARCRGVSVLGSRVKFTPPWGARSLPSHAMLPAESLQPLGSRHTSARASRAKAPDRPQGPQSQPGVLAITAAAVVAAALIGASLAFRRRSSPTPATVIVDTSAVNGIPRSGLVLGNPARRA